MDISILGSSTTNFQCFSNFKDENRNMHRAFRNFLDEIILQNAKRQTDYWSLFASDLSHSEKKILLSYLVDIETYADLTENLYRELEALKEYESEMQYFIDLRIDDFYHEYMEDLKNDCDGYDSCEITSLT